MKLKTGFRVLIYQEQMSEVDKSPRSPSLINAFELIGMSSYLDLSGFFEKEVREKLFLINSSHCSGNALFLTVCNLIFPNTNQDVSERNIRFTSNHSAKDLLKKIEDMVTEMGFRVQKKNGKVCSTDIWNFYAFLGRTKNTWLTWNIINPEQRLCLWL